METAERLVVSTENSTTHPRTKLVFTVEGSVSEADEAEGTLVEVPLLLAAAAWLGEALDGEEEEDGDANADLAPTALRKASCPTFSRCRAMMDSIFFFSSSIRRRRCSSFRRTLFSWEAMASKKTINDHDNILA